MSSTVPISQIYSPLNKTERQIRLIKLTSAESTEILACELFLASLDDKPSFKALSYTWGDAADTRTISVNGLSVKIRKNLHDAFQIISQDQHNATVIWADALCINQDDDEEKTHQVGMMEKVYQSAEEVIVWLGHPPDREHFGDDSSLEQLQRLQDTLKELYTQEKNCNLTLASLPPFTDQSSEPDKETLPLGILMSEPPHDGEGFEENNVSEVDTMISRKLEGTFGIALLRGLVPSELDEWIPDVINDLDRDALVHWLKVKHFGFESHAGFLAIHNTAEQNNCANTIDKHINRILKLEDSILLHSLSKGQTDEGISWNYNESGAQISKFYMNAFTKGIVQPDYHIIGAFCMLGQIANDDHFHELFFFKPENQNYLFYPSMLWRHCVRAAVVLLQQSYWSRIWIVQEILLSSSTNFRYGKHTAPIQLIVDACLCFEKHYRTCCSNFGQPEVNHTYSYWGQLTNAFIQLNSFMRLSVDRKHLRIEKLLHPKLSFRSATDSRDYVYGVLGLVADGSGVSIVPDYTKTVKDAFVRATLAIIEDNDNLDYLTKLEWADRSGVLPTWVPNWAFDGFERIGPSGGKLIFNIPGPLKEHYELFKASGERIPFYRLIDDSVLEVKGFLVDTIVEVFPTIEIQPADNLIFQIMGVINWITGLRKRKPGISEETLWSTLLCGAFREQNGLRLMIPSDVPKLTTWLNATFDAISSNLGAPHAWSVGQNNFITRWFSFIVNEKQLFVTKSGRIGLGSARFGHPIREGDEAQILNGFRMPVILRPVPPNRLMPSSNLDSSSTYPELSTGSSELLKTKSTNFSIDSQSFQSHVPGTEVRNAFEHSYEYMSSCYIENIMQGEMAKDIFITSSSIFLV